jgi:predicted tellurium resistance membrane protein TerC
VHVIPPERRGGRAIALELCMTELIASPAFWLSLTTLTFLEIVLGIDNLLFISIAVGKLKSAAQARARRIGIWGAMALRIIMLAGIFWIVQLGTAPLLTLPAGWAAVLGEADEHARAEFISFTVKDLILFAGGLFLLWKGTQEIHQSVQGTHHEEAAAKETFSAVVVQLAVINIVFSLDSVITAVGMTNILEVMVLAVVLSTIVMAFAAAPLGAFIERHPTTKMLALAFILLVGVALVADGLGFHIPRGYLYFAIAFSLAVELLNIRMRERSERAVS